MANSAGSKKRARQAVKRNKHNAQIRARVRTFIKKTTYALEAADKKTSQSSFLIMQKALDQAADKGLIHKNKAARKKSRLCARIKAL